MPTRRQTVCLLIVLFFRGYSPLAAAQYSHSVWRTEDGLPHNRVQAIAQTPDGYLWLGTSEGLARFDGVRFVTFDKANTPALKDNSILSMGLAPDGTLWIGTEGGGLVHRSPNTFTSFGAQEGLTNGFVRAIYFDRTGSLWVGTDRGLFQHLAGHFARLDNTPEVPLASVISIAEDAGGTIWIGTATGLLQLRNRKLAPAPCTRKPGAETNLSVALVAEKLARDGCTAPDSQLPDVPISSLLRDVSGNLWVGTTGEGLIFRDGTSGALASYTAPSVLPDNTVVRLFEDRQRNVWVAAQGGLVRFSQATVTTVGAREGVKDENVSTTYEDRQGTLWIVTFSGQIYRLRGDTPERFLLPGTARDVRTRAVFQDSKNNYWFGSNGAGAFRLAQGKLRQYTRKDGLRSDAIRQIFEDSRGLLWFATGSGISVWDGKAFSNYYMEQGLSYPSVRCLEETGDGDVLAGTDAGLNRFHAGRIVHDAALANLQQEKISSLYVDRKDIWLGTRGGGLVLLRNGSLTRLTAREGLVSNSIYKIIDDKAGRLWMSSPVGLFAVRKSEIDDVVAHKASGIHAIAYGTSDGMDTSQMSSGVQPAGCRRSSGELWFPTLRGAVKLDPAHLPARLPAPVLIESVIVGETAFPFTGEIEIPPGRGRIQINFTACDLTSPRQLSFRYKLEGFDDTWTDATRQRSAVYSNPPAGRFRFRVIAEDANSPSAASEASLAIFHHPEFHQTGWFYTSVAALIASLLWAGMWIYTQQTKARFTLLLNERTRLAREMHDTVIQGCVGVSTLLEAVARLQRSDVNEAGKLLANARTEIKATLEEARQAVWDLRHSDEEKSSIFTLLDLARKLANEHSVSVSTEVRGEQRPLNVDIGRTLLLVGREALRNCVAHASPSQIDLCITFQPACVLMEVKDNGKGFETDLAELEKNGHFGIAGMRERVEQFGGKFSIQSREGAGTAVLVSLPAST